MPVIPEGVPTVFFTYNIVSWAFEGRERERSEDLSIVPHLVEDLVIRVEHVTKVDLREGLVWETNPPDCECGLLVSLVVGITRHIWKVKEICDEIKLAPFSPMFQAKIPINSLLRPGENRVEIYVKPKQDKLEDLCVANLRISM